MHLYSALLCIVVHPKGFTTMWGVSPQQPPVYSIHLDDATTATAQRHQCAHHTPATGGEERESFSQSSVCAHHTPATGGEERESFSQSSVCAHHTPATGGEERESFSQSSVCAHHTPATGGEERESLSQSSGWGLLGGHDWQGPVVGIWIWHQGYTPTLYEKYHWIFNDHREAGPRFNISSEIQCFLTV